MIKKLLVLLGLAGAGAAVAAKRKKAADAEAALWAEATGGAKSATAATSAETRAPFRTEHTRSF